MEVWDLGGTRNHKQLERLVAHPAEVIANSRFLGQVQVPLGDTLAFQRGMSGLLPSTRALAVYTCFDRPS